MKLIRKLKKLIHLIRLMPKPVWAAWQIFPDYVVSIADQKISAEQLRYALNSFNSSVAATPIVSYVDWVERNKELGIFNNYPRLPEYQTILENYFSKIDRMHLVLAFLESTKAVHGDIAEFGVYKGHTSILLNQAREKWQNGKRLHLFDSYEGLPDEIGPDDGFYAGQFSDTSAARVKEIVGGGDQVNIVKGFFSQTLPTLPDLHFSFCHIDCDLEIAVLECLEYIYPRLSYGGILVFDDYGFRPCVGLRKAVDNFFANKGEKVISLPTSQAAYIKLNGQ